MDTIRTFFPKLGHFFRFSKKDRRGIMFLTEFSYTLFTKTLLLFCISLLSFIYRRGNTSQILLGATTPVTLNKNQIKTIHFLSGKSVPLLKLSTVCPQEKSSHKKIHAYLTDSEYFTCLLKKRSRLQYMSQSGLVKRLVGLQNVWLLFVNNAPVSSPPSTTIFR